MPVKRYAPLALLLLAGIGAIVLVQRQHIGAVPSPQAVLTAAADAQHELTRLPAHFDRMSDADEIALGNELATHQVESLSSTRVAQPEDARIQAYLQRVGERAATHARRRLPWTFHYIPDAGFVNAFALPGGHVFVGQGLLALMHSEDALAAVLGHEIEHVDLRHCAERAQTEAQLNHLGALGELVGFPVEIFMAGYSKEQELEADRDGATLAVEAGYSYTGVLQLFDEFAKLEGDAAKAAPRSGGPITEALGLSVRTLSGYFASHPPSRQRSEQLQALASERDWRPKPLTCLHETAPSYNGQGTDQHPAEGCVSG